MFFYWFFSSFLAFEALNTINSVLTAVWPGKSHLHVLQALLMGKLHDIDNTFKECEQILTQEAFESFKCLQCTQISPINSNSLIFLPFSERKEHKHDPSPHGVPGFSFLPPHFSPQELTLWVHLQWVPQEDLTWGPLLITLQCRTQGWPVTGAKGQWLEHVSSAPFAPIMTCAPPARAKTSTRSMLSCPSFTPWPTCLRWMPVLLLLCLCVLYYIQYILFSKWSEHADSSKSFVCSGSLVGSFCVRWDTACGQIPRLRLRLKLKLNTRLSQAHLESSKTRMLLKTWERTVRHHQSSSLI